MKAVYDAIVLNDYPEKHYATWADEQLKTLETRMIRFKKFPRDLVICCGAKSVTRNAGFALCLMNFGQPESMLDEHEKDAMIENKKGRWVYRLTNRREFNRKFSFSKCRVSGSFQSIFQIQLPDDVRVITPLPIINKKF